MDFSGELMIFIQKLASNRSDFKFGSRIDDDDLLWQLLMPAEAIATSNDIASS